LCEASVQGETKAAAEIRWGITVCIRRERVSPSSRKRCASSLVQPTTNVRWSAGERTAAARRQRRAAAKARACCCARAAPGLPGPGALAWLLRILLLAPCNGELEL